MIWEDLKEELVLTDLDAESSGEVFERLGKTLIEEGYCRESYIDALKTREKDFPTGVNMGGVGIAIPHTDKSHVYKGAVAIGILKKPVKFYQMGTTDEVVMARLVFMLAVDDPEGIFTKDSAGAAGFKHTETIDGVYEKTGRHPHYKRKRTVTFLNRKNERRFIMSAVNILSVCGSGTVTSSMVAAKLKEKLGERGYSVSTTEARPTEALNLAQSGRFDVLAHTSPLPDGDYGIPMVNAFACITGMGEDEFFNQIVEALRSVGK